MKTLKSFLLILIISLVFILNICSSSRYVNAMSDDTYSVPYSTYTLGTGSRLVKTQTAFVPVGVMNLTYLGEKMEISGAQDIFYLDQKLYIASSSSKMIIVASMDGTVERIIRRVKYNGETINFNNPTGVFADSSYIYVADKGNAQVYMIDSDDNIVKLIEKPTSQLYGTDTPFSPTKVAVQKNGSFYIISEGTTTGVIEINYALEFVGFLGINTVETSLRTAIYNLLFSSGLASSRPASPLNVALGEKSSILTINSSINTETIKRLNIDGINTLSSDTYYPSVTLVDITMSDENYIYTISETGTIYEYDRNGNLLFVFNTYDQAQTQVMGLTSGASGIVVDENNTLYVVDSKYNNIQIYEKTVFVSLVHKAMTLYNEGKYEESKPIFEEIIRQNTSFAKAHSALGMALYKEGDFNQALSEFSLAKDKTGYSNAFWEIRNIFIQNYSIYILIAIIGLIIVSTIVKILKKKTKVFVSLDNGVLKIKENKIVSGLDYSFHIIKHPIDTFYGIKRQKKIGIISASIMFLLFVVVYIINLYASGFLFKNDLGRQGAIMNIFSVIGIVLLYVVCNYLISTLNDGEGKLKDIFIATITSLIPYIILILPLTLITHVLTYNEEIIITIYKTIVYGWCAILLFLSIQEIHNYGFFETIKCILLTAFAMVLFILFILLIYTFLSQLFDFISSVLKEVSLRG